MLELTFPDWFPSLEVCGVVDVRRCDLHPPPTTDLDPTPAPTTVALGSETPKRVAAPEPATPPRQDPTAPAVAEAQESTPAASPSQTEGLGKKGGGKGGKRRAESLSLSALTSRLCGFRLDKTCQVLPPPLPPRAPEPLFVMSADDSPLSAPRAIKTAAFRVQMVLKLNGVLFLLRSISVCVGRRPTGRCAPCLRSRSTTPRWMRTLWHWSTLRSRAHEFRIQELVPTSTSSDRRLLHRRPNLVSDCQP